MSPFDQNINPYRPRKQTTEGWNTLTRLYGQQVTHGDHSVEGYSMQNINFNFPTMLHCACTIPNITEETIKEIIEYDPRALMVKDEVGETPIMRAVLSGEASDDILMHLIHACPQALGCQDDDGKYHTLKELDVP